MSEETELWAKDCFDRKTFGALLLAFLQGEAVFSDEAYVLALTGRFGSGKTYFLNNWKDELIRLSKAKPGTIPLVVTVNAWVSDFSGEPLLAIVSEIVAQLASTQKGKEDEALKELKRGLAGAAGVAKLALGGWLEEKTGVAIEDVSTAFTEGASGDELDRRANSLLSEFKARRLALERLRSSMGKLIKSRSGIDGESELKLILIVDELDRCHPRYAIEFLEAIKHVFNVGGLAVVLGVDWEQLSCTATACFGIGLNTEEYLRKFVKRRVRLPDGDQAGMKSLSEKFFATYLRDKSDGNSAWDLMVRQEGEPGALLGSYFQALGVTPRQADLIVHLLSFSYRSAGRAHWQNYPIDLFIATLAGTGGSMFDELLQAERDPAPILASLSKLKLRSRIEQSRYNAELIEGRILASLICRSNSDDFLSKASKVGFVTARESNGQSMPTEFGEIASRVGNPSRSYAVTFANRLLELGEFFR